MRVTFVRRSGNEKTGPIPVSMTERRSCPTSCVFRGNGCYAEGWPMRLHWDKVPTAGVTWGKFLQAVQALPKGTLWRHNSAGDLPHRGQVIDRDAVDALVEANRGRRGFTYTHHDMSVRENRAVVADANLRGLTINVSHDSLEHLDRGVAGVLPSVVVLPMLRRGEIEPRVTYSPAGHRVVTCPAQYKVDVTCQTCGLCQRANRACVVGFRAHGAARRKASDISERKPVRRLSVIQ